MDTPPSEQGLPQERRLPALDEVSYQLLAARALHYDESMWQVPVLSLTAQAFLFTTALGSGEPGSRLVAAFLSAVVAAISVQLMAKQRWHQLLDLVWLHEHEKAASNSHEITVFSPSWERGPAIEAIDRWPKPRRLSVLRWKMLIRQSSFEIWTVGLAIFGLVALGVAVSSLVELLR